MQEKLFSVTETAEMLGVSRTRILQMIKTGRIKAEKIGNNWVFTALQIEAVKDRKPGRPVKK